MTHVQKYALIEYMPAHLRASHEAARNSGTYPHNGAVRCYVPADLVAEIDVTWTAVVADSVPRAALATDHYQVYPHLPDEA